MYKVFQVNLPQVLFDNNENLNPNNKQKKIIKEIITRISFQM